MPGRAQSSSRWLSRTAHSHGAAVGERLAGFRAFRFFGDFLGGELLWSLFRELSDGLVGTEARRFTPDVLRLEGTRTEVVDLACGARRLSRRTNSTAVK